MLVAWSFAAFIAIRLALEGADSLRLFTLHPLFAAVAVTLASWAIASVQTAKPPHAGIASHRLLHALAMVAFSVAFTAIYINKNNYGKEHFLTWHSWAGLASVSLYPTVSTVGYLILTFPGLFGGEKVARLYFYRMHRANYFLWLFFLFYFFF